MSDVRARMSRIGAMSCMLALAALLAACEDAPPEAESPPPEPRRAVSAEERAFRDAVVASLTFASPELASQARQFYDALDAGEQSRAVRDVGGLAMVKAELRAAEMFHFAHKLDGCILRTFRTRTPEGQLRLLQRLAQGPHGAAMIADAKRHDAEGYAFDLTGYGDRPNRAQQVAAAYDTLSLQWRTIGSRKGNDNAVRVFAQTMMHLAAVSDGKCVPDPKLLSLIESMP